MHPWTMIPSFVGYWITIKNDVLLQRFDVLSIKRRLALNDFNFMHDVFSGRINSPHIPSMFSLAVQCGRTRSRPVLRDPPARVETIKSGMFCRLPRLVNGLCVTWPTADLFASLRLRKRPALLCARCDSGLTGWWG